MNVAFENDNRSENAESVKPGAKSDLTSMTGDTSRKMSRKSSQLDIDHSVNKAHIRTRNRETAHNSVHLSMSVDNNSEYNNDNLHAEADVDQEVQKIKINPIELLTKNEIKKVIMRTDRRDYYGNNIIKGQKHHKVTFIDKVKKNKKLADIVFIDNIKKFLKNGKFDDEECKCVIF